MFKEYLHVERFGNEAVEGIELGEVYVFPKLDGTNASMWVCKQKVDGSRKMNAGSRTRQLSIESDNAGFCLWMREAASGKDLRHRMFLHNNPNLRLFGEWLVPHSFKGYRPDSWRQFYVFDVYNDETGQYLSYPVYQPLLEEFGITYIPPLAVVKNGDYERFLHYVANNYFLCPDGGEPGEGIVIKNYDYQNKFGRQAFAKIVRQEFKELHARTMGAPEVNGGLMNEERILDKCLTTSLIDKTIAKMLNVQHICEIAPKQGWPGWTSKMIPELFGRVYYDIIKEELFDALKEINYGNVNFKTLKAVMINRIKKLKPELF